MQEESTAGKFVIRGNHITTGRIFASQEEDAKERPGGKSHKKSWD